VQVLGEKKGEGLNFLGNHNAKYLKKREYDGLAGLQRPEPSGPGDVTPFKRKENRSSKNLEKRGEGEGKRQTSIMPRAGHPPFCMIGGLTSLSGKGKVTCQGGLPLLSKRLNKAHFRRLNCDQRREKGGGGREHNMSPYAACRHMRRAGLALSRKIVPSAALPFR